METVTSNTQDTGRTISYEEAREALRTLISYIGEDPDREGLASTPDRILRMWQEIFRGYKPAYKPAITTFTNDAHSSDIIFDAGNYYSMCEHHLLPFFGKYYFAYIPSPTGRILGISKVARVVAYCASRMQLQERLGHDIIDMLSDALDGEALGFAIILKGQHMCKSMRGIKNPGCMTTSYYTGSFKDNPQLRNEFLHMISMQD